MDIIQKAIWVELKHKVLNIAIAVQDDYPKDDILAELIDLVKTIENCEPKNF